MNIDFQSIKRIKINGEEYFLQRAEVTHNQKFWAAWRYAKAAEAEADSLHTPRPARLLTSIVALTKAVRESEYVWIAYRLLPVISGGNLGKFPSSYLLRDPSKLLPYQPEAVQALCASIVCNGAAADGSDCGIGKTYHAIAVAREFGLSPAIVCRISGISTWRRVCNHFGINPLFIVNWEQAKNGRFKYAIRKQDPVSGHYKYIWDLPKKSLLIFDEAHMACNESSQNFSLWQASKGRASLSLSATFADRPERLKGLLNLLNAVDADTFKSWLSKRGTFVNQYDENESLSSIADMQDIHRVIYPRYGFRLSYDHPAVKAFFPEAVYQTEIVSIGQSQEEKQNDLYNQMISKVEYYRSLGKQADALAADLRYRQAAELIKADALLDLIDDYREQGKSVCVFVNFRETLAYLAKATKSKSLIFGEQERYHINRDAVIDDFQNGKTNLILSMVTAGGQSISLHDLFGNRPRVSLVCPTYDPIALQQVFGRTHRSGSKSVPIIKLVYAARTIEEKVADTVNQKLNNIKALNEGDLLEPDLFKLSFSKGDES